MFCVNTIFGNSNQNSEKMDDQDRKKMEDPQKKFPQPPFPEQGKEQPFPGREGKMHPRVDHGEDSYRGTGKLEGKNAIITGADSGIGRAVAIAFAREGANVLVAYLEEDEDARETARLVE